MKKQEQLKREVSYIRNPKYRENANRLIELLPDYFFEVPASSTGKYHPSYTLGDGGLVRHVKAAVRIGHELLENPITGGKFTNDEKDLIILALILHDGLKSGLVKQKYTQVDHPLLVSNYIKDNKDKLSLTDNEILALTNMIESHMGIWNKDYNGNEVLPIPVNKYQKFVHMCDYLASRKFLEVPFENNEIVG
jgi:hypothetical protein